MSSALEEAKQQFNNWRKTKNGRERIPASLWQKAVEVYQAGEDSLHKISKTLHLNHTDFKKHIKKQLPQAIDQKTEASPFILT